MSDPFIGEIRAVSFNYAPQGWTLCNGQLLQVAQYQALFALLSTTYGGDGTKTFGVPNLQGRSIVHVGTGVNLPTVQWAQPIGAASVALTPAMTPVHTHGALINDPGHTHSGVLPQHTHSFAIPCDDGTAGPTEASPVGAYLTQSTGVDDSVNVTVKDANALGDVVSQGGTTPVGYPFNAVAGTSLYATSTNATMGTGDTGQNSAGIAVPIAVHSTGITASVVPTPGPSEPVPTQSPGLGLYYIIALEGIWPPRC